MTAQLTDFPRPDNIQPGSTGFLYSGSEALAFVLELSCYSGPFIATLNPSHHAFPFFSFDCCLCRRTPFNVTPRNSPCVSVGMDSGSAEKLFRPILRLDITFNDGGRCSITNRNSAITSRPESLSPKHVTNFRMKFGTYSQCRNGFERSN